jgi:hypothetical protein
MRTWQEAAQASTASRSCGSDTAHTRHWSCVMMTFAFSSANLRGSSRMLFGRRFLLSANSCHRCHAASAVFFAYTNLQPFEVNLNTRLSAYMVYTHRPACMNQGRHISAKCRCCLHVTATVTGNKTIRSISKVLLTFTMSRTAVSIATLGALGSMLGSEHDGSCRHQRRCSNSKNVLSGVPEA